MKKDEGYYVVIVNADIKEIIDKKKQPNRYGDPFIWEHLEECKEWVMKRLYKGMSHKYMIIEPVSFGCYRKTWLISRDNEGQDNIEMRWELNV